MTASTPSPPSPPSTLSADEVYLCPVDVPLRHLGGKWKLILCFYLLLEPRRNGELRRLVPGMPQKMLTQQLRELEQSGLVRRVVHDQLPPKVVYSIVEDERAELQKVVDTMCGWGLDRVANHGGQILNTTVPEIHDARSRP
jgi:DNA-binding HxlR family transcriptional regulator